MNHISMWELIIILFFVCIPATSVWFRTVVDIFDRRDLSGRQRTAFLA